MKLRFVYSALIALFMTHSLCLHSESLSKKTIGSTDFYCYKVKAKETIFGISKKFNITQDELKQYNPAIRDGLKKDYILLLPVTLIDARENMPNVSVNQAQSFTHIVKKGETLYGISKTYGISQEEIIAKNPQAVSGIKLGQELIIPQPVANDNSSNNDTSKDKIIYHTIANGETLYRLSKNYNTSIENILRLNPGISPENFKIGTVVKIIANAPKTEKIETTVTVMESYIAEKGDNMKKIAKRTGVDVDDLEDANPNIKKVQTGMTIQIPVEKLDSVDVLVSEGTEKDLQHNESERIKEIYDSIHDVRKNNAINIALILPYMLNDSIETKQAKLYAEFYKGFLLSVNEIKDQFDNDINIYTYDTEGKTDKLMTILSKPEFKSMDLIFAPDDINQLDSISSFSKVNGTYVVNAFSVKDENYDNNPYMFQINIPQEYMYVDVCDWISSDFKDYEFVFVHKKGIAKKDIAYKLKSHLESENMIVKEVEYTSVLTYDILLEQVNVNKKTVFIPTSGTKTVLSQMIPALKKLKAENPLLESAVVGYPEWVVYMEDWKEDYHTLNTHFYSRVFVDNSDIKTDLFNEEYQKWYGEDLIPATPSFGYLGYDTGLYFLGELCKNKKNLSHSTSEYHGIQSSFKFERISNWSGFVNQSLFILHFEPDNNIEIIIK